MRYVTLFAVALVTGCSQPSGTANGEAPANGAAVAEPSPDARAAQGAAAKYVAAIQRGDYAAARAMWGHDGAASGGTAADLARGYAEYSRLDLVAGTPGEIASRDGVARTVVPVSGTALLKARKAQRTLAGSIYLSRDDEQAGTARGTWHIWAADIRHPH